MILIADCGSTKTDWCVVSCGDIVRRVSTGGMNAVMLTEEEMTRRIASELLPLLGDENIDRVYFYGAGCLADEVCDNVRRAIAADYRSIYRPAGRGPRSLRPRARHSVHYGHRLQFMLL